MGVRGVARSPPTPNGAVIRWTDREEFGITVVFMKRIWILGARLLSLALALEGGSVESADRPNIVLAIADDLTWTSLPCYGNPDAVTPNIDRLAAEGMRMSHMFTSTAMCAPTRAQLYTGLFPVRNGAYPNHSSIRPTVRTLPDYLREAGYRVGLNGKRHFKPAKQFPFERIGGGRFDERAIEAFMGADPETPFLLVMASHSPHVPWSSGDAAAYDPEALTVPPNLVDTPETRAALARYYGEVSEVDRELGVIMDALDQQGLSDNTVVIFTTEQGAQFPGAKWTCYEEGLHVGLIVRWPGEIQSGAVSKAWTHYVDITPTLLDIAGAARRPALDGRSILELWRGERDAHRTETFGIHTQKGAIGSPETGYPVRSVRVGNLKYIWNLNSNASFANALTTNDKEDYWGSWVEKAETDATARELVTRYLERPEEELYDLSNDPHERRNLAQVPEMSLEKLRLRSRLLLWMREQGDFGIETEMDFRTAQKGLWGASGEN